MEAALGTSIVLYSYLGTYLHTQGPRYLPACLRPNERTALDVILPWSQSPSLVHVRVRPTLAFPPFLTDTFAPTSPHLASPSSPRYTYLHT